MTLPVFLPSGGFSAGHEREISFSFLKEFSCFLYSLSLFLLNGREFFGSYFSTLSRKGVFGCCHLQFGLQTKLATGKQCKSWHMTANAMGWALSGSPHVIGLGLGRSPQIGYEEYNLCSLLEASRLGEVVEYDFKSMSYTSQVRVRLSRGQLRTTRPLFQVPRDLDPTACQSSANPLSAEPSICEHVLC